MDLPFILKFGSSKVTLWVEAIMVDQALSWIADASLRVECIYKWETSSWEWFNDFWDSFWIDLMGFGQESYKLLVTFVIAGVISYFYMLDPIILGPGHFWLGFCTLTVLFSMNGLLPNFNFFKNFFCAWPKIFHYFINYKI